MDTVGSGQDRKHEGLTLNFTVCELVPSLIWQDGFEDVFTATAMAALEYGAMPYARGLIDAQYHHYIRYAGAVHASSATLIFWRVGMLACRSGTVETVLTREVLTRTSSPAQVITCTQVKPTLQGFDGMWLAQV